MTNEELAQALDQLDDDALLVALNKTLVKRQKPPSDDELAAAEYEKYYPGSTK